MSPSTWVSCGLAKTYQSIIDFLVTPMEQITETFGRLMMLDIHFSYLGPYWARFSYIASALVVLLLIYAGYLMLFGAIDAEKRRAAKKQLIDLLYIIFFINISLLLGWLLLQSFNGLLAFIWKSFLNEKIVDMPLSKIIINAGSTLLLAVLYLIVFIFIGIPFFLKIITRHLVVMILLVTLPITIILYYFTPTKPYGRKLLELLAINIAFPFIWMLIFAMAKVAVNVIEATFLPISFGTLQFLSLTAALYANNKLYKTIGLNFDIASPVTETIRSVKSVYRQIPPGMKSDFQKFRERWKERSWRKKEFSYKDYRDPIGDAVER